MELNWTVDLFGPESLIQTIATSISEGIIAFISFHFILRLPLLKQESKNFRTWNGNIGNLYRRCGFTPQVYILLILAAMYKMVSSNSITSDGRLSILQYGSWFTSYCLVRWSKIDECPAWQAQMLDGMSGLDYSSCMADSYFNGYLQIILPAKMSQKNKSLRQRINQFMDEHKIRDEEFPVQSLIVMVPKSGKCSPLLSDDPKIPQEDREKIQTCSKLEEYTLNRAGTCGRVYSAAAYRIDLDPRTAAIHGVSHFYAVAEQATIVQTFRESLEKNVYNAERLREHTTEIIHKFYRDIKKYLHQSTDCHGLAEVVYYDDDKDVVSALRSFLIQKSLEIQHKMKRVDP